MLMETWSVGDTVLVFVACVPAKTAGVTTSSIATTEITNFFIESLSLHLNVFLDLIPDGQCPCRGLHSLVSAINWQRYFRNLLITQRVRGEKLQLLASGG